PSDLWHVTSTAHSFGLPLGRRAMRPSGCRDGRRTSRSAARPPGNENGGAPARVPRRRRRSVAALRRCYFRTLARTSTTKTRVSSPLIVGGLPSLPYPSEGGRTSRRRLPTFAPVSPLSKPG